MLETFIQNEIIFHNKNWNWILNPNEPNSGESERIDYVSNFWRKHWKGNFQKSVCRKLEQREHVF